MRPDIDESKFRKDSDAGEAIWPTSDTPKASKKPLTDVPSRRKNDHSSLYSESGEGNQTNSVAGRVETMAKCFSMDTFHTDPIDFFAVSRPALQKLRKETMQNRRGSITKIAENASKIPTSAMKWPPESYSGITDGEMDGFPCEARQVLHPTQAAAPSPSRIKNIQLREANTARQYSCGLVTQASWDLVDSSRSSSSGSIGGSNTTTASSTTTAAAAHGQSSSQHKISGNSHYRAPRNVMGSAQYEDVDWGDLMHSRSQAQQGIGSSFTPPKASTASRSLTAMRQPQGVPIDPAKSPSKKTGTTHDGSKDTSAQPALYCVVCCRDKHTTPTCPTTGLRHSIKTIAT